ncbi:hypothetical protein O181_007177 [Austropuccinia psidii MF-1]|uniref:Uncharacterized protein n=1 Tax=Austropuccinia psidii MF-1 TaxID=1389203 RepID=A0A9Q3BM82_9BASI|nr:hypothetical protein [Austropuccinia psidii MF-1]
MVRSSLNLKSLGIKSPYTYQLDGWPGRSDYQNQSHHQFHKTLDQSINLLSFTILCRQPHHHLFINQFNPSQPQPQPQSSFSLHSLQTISLLFRKNHYHHHHP